MRNWILATVVLVGLSGASPVLANAETVNQPCAERSHVSACSVVSGVDLTGMNSASGEAPTSDAVPPGQDRAPRVGDVRSIACDGGEEAAVGALGDRQPMMAAQNCASWRITCANAQQLTGGVQVPSLYEVLGDAGWVHQGAGCSAAAGGPPVVSAEVVREWARRELPAVRLGLAPETQTLVNIQTIMWVNTQTQTQTQTQTEVALPAVQLLGQDIAVRVRVDRVHWVFGDGHSADSPGLGRAFTDQDHCGTAQCPGFFGHTYTATGKMTVTASVTWSASFSVNGAPDTPIPSGLSGPAATATLTVAQARAVLVPPPTR